MIKLGWSGWFVFFIWFFFFFLYKENNMYLPFRKLCKLMVLLLHWFIPYKGERWKESFQCETSKNCQGVHEFSWSKKCTHNINFFLTKKNVLKNGSGSGSGTGTGWVDLQKNTGRVMGQLVFYSSQKILTCFAMSSYNLHVDSRKL